MLFKLSVIFFIITVNFSFINGSINITTLLLNPPEDSYLTTPELIRKYNYTCDVHSITTSDNYILEIHRIPTTSVSKIPVLLVHGLGGSSADFVIQGVPNGLAYLLSDLGYDVWLMNARGNRYSRKHLTLNPDKDIEYWYFSWHEIGVFDLPATIDYVLLKTGHTKLFHIGHSQGGTTFYVMASERPEYNSKIRAHFSLAPAVYMKHITHPLMQVLAKLVPILKVVVDVLGLHDISSANLLRLYTPTFCNIDDITRLLCTNVVFLLFGFNYKEMNMTLVPVFFGHYPAGFATYQLIHYGQEINSGEFHQFDYGPFRNLLKYFSITPPMYPLKKVTASVYLFYSLNDLLVSPIDIKKLPKKLPNLRLLHKVPGEWSHADYILGINAKTKVYDFITTNMQNHLN